MISFSYDQIFFYISAFWFPFCRIIGCFVFMPIIGESSVPKMTRVGLAIMFSCLMLNSSLQNTIQVDLLSISAILLSFQELLIGFMMSLSLQIMLNVLTMIGSLLSAQMGLSMANVNDPSNGSSPIVGHLLFMFGVLLFLTIDGHLVFFDILSNSFSLFPVGSSVFDLNLIGFIKRLSWMFVASTLLALPAIVAMLIISFVFGVLNRSAPALNIYSLGFPLSQIMGLICVLLMFYGLADKYSNLCIDSLNSIMIFIQGK